MRNRTKTRIFKLLNLLPRDLGYLIYHKLQMVTLKKVEFYLKTNEVSFQQIRKILSENNIILRGKDIIEIGSGWFPIMPFIFKEKLEVNNIYTYDINKHYSPKRILNSSKLFCDQLKVPPSKKLPSFIKYFPYTNIQKAIINYSPELVYSRFVLEHISPEELLEIHKNLYKNTSAETRILHLISPSDHRSYSDKSLSSYDFLKYSESEWNKIQTKFDYHNRLRLPDYLQIFEKSGYKVEFLSYDKVQKNSKKYKLFKQLELSSSYKKYSEEEVLAGSINVLLSK